MRNTKRTPDLLPDLPGQIIATIVAIGVGIILAYALAA
jgi:hypothetical protein